MGEPYNNLAIMFARLYNESPRDKGKLDKYVTGHMKGIIDALEKRFNPDVDAHAVRKDECLTQCCSLALEGTETCVDRLAVVLIQMHLSCQLYSAKDNPDQQDRLQQDLKMIEQVTRFVVDLSESKILYDNSTQTFISTREAEKKILKTNEFDTYENKHDYYLLTTQQIKETDLNIQSFSIGDPVEDTLQLINELSKDKIIHTQGATMRWGMCATLKGKEQLKAATTYIHNSYLTSLETP